MKYSKLAAIWLPSKSNDALCKMGREIRTKRIYKRQSENKKRQYYPLFTFHLHHIHRHLLLSHSEDLKVGDNALKYKQN